MATLAYAVVQSTTNTLMPIKVKTVVEGLKPVGRSYFTTTFVPSKFVFDTTKPSGYSAKTSLNPTNLISIIKSNITFGFQNNGNLISTKKLAATQWYTKGTTFFNSASSNLVATVRPSSSWYPNAMSTPSSSALVDMKSGNLQYGLLTIPYTYDSITTSTLMTSKISIVNTQFSTPVETMYSEKMLTLKTGAIAAYGEVSRNAGWTN